MDIYEKLKKLASVSHMNFLFGAGASRDYLPLLNDIEEKMNEAEEANNTEELYKLRKRYFTEVMYPNLAILKSAKKEKELEETYINYREFFRLTTESLLNRKSTLLDKQVNVFTTNIDIFMDKVLEDMTINFNDGFLGRISPKLDTSSFSTILKKKSEHFNKQSEIPTFNLYKLHGSLNWIQSKPFNGDSEILYSDLSAISDLNEAKGKKDQFNSKYEKLAVVNPSNKKFATTLVEYIYYEMLRLYSTSLEKEQSILFVIGFSFSDKHILKMTKRALNANPTLSICIFSYSSEAIDYFETLFRDVRYKNNVYILGPEDKEKKMNLSHINANALSKIYRENNLENGS